MTETKFEKRNLFPADEVQKTGAALLSLKNKGFTEGYVSATVGLAQSGKADWQLEAEQIFFSEAKEYSPGYNFGVNTKFAEEVVLKCLFDGEVDASKLVVIAASGGSDALSKIIGVLDGPLVPVGMPNWPNTRGIIERKGGVVFPYLDFDANTGEFNSQNAMDFIGSMESIFKKANEVQLGISTFSQYNAFKKITGMHAVHAGLFLPKWFGEKMVTPLFHAVCKNPTGVDIPAEMDGVNVWDKIANRALERNIILIIDAAYLGFGEDLSEDNRMVKYFAKKGVKMMIAFSGSKLYNQYGNMRIGSVVAVNFPDTVDVKKKLLFEGRNTTSAVGTDAQHFAVITEQYLGSEHKEWLKDRRNNASRNREIIAGGVRSPHVKNILLNGKGLFATLPQKFAGWIFPELAEKMDVDVPAESQNFPSDLKRVAGVITPDSGLGDGNVRLNVMQINASEASEIAKTLKYAEEMIF